MAASASVPVDSGAVGSGPADKRWHIAVFSSREDRSTIEGTAAAAVRAAAHAARSTVDIVINGNPSLAADLARADSLRDVPARVRLRVWDVPLGDKAHAWNEFVHRIWEPADTSFFVDGYARVLSPSFSMIEAALASEPEALAASGAPSMGLTAWLMRRRVSSEGGLFGNLYALRASLMMALRERQFRLPLGIYRTDPLLGAAIYFDLDPSAHAWNRRRIVTVWQPTWTFSPLRFWRASDLRAFFRRRLRQAQGTLETAAIRQHLAIERRRPEALPGSAAAMVAQWVAAFPDEAGRLLSRQPLCRRALAEMSKPRDWAAAAIPPELRVTHGA